MVAATSRSAAIGRRLILAGALVFAGLLALSPLDLPLAREAFSPTLAFGRIVQDFGTVPAGLLYVAGVLLLLVERWRRGCPLLTRAATALLAQGLLHPLALTTVLKLLWGRPRPTQVLAGSLGFAPLWLPDPLSGNISFPSGHVAAALVGLPVVLVLREARRPRAATAVLGASALWGAVVAAGRILFGAHFLTDVLFSAAVAALLAPLSLRAGDAWLRALERSAAARRKPVQPGGDR